jgi:hypothetical protein
MQINSPTGQKPDDVIEEPPESRRPPLLLAISASQTTAVAIATATRPNDPRPDG